MCVNKQTKAKLSKETQKKFNILREYYSGEKGFLNYRRAIKNIKPPAIPLISMLLTELQYITEGNQARLDGDNLIYWGKYHSFSERMHFLKQFHDFCQEFYLLP